MHERYVAVSILARAIVVRACVRGVLGVKLGVTRGILMGDLLPQGTRRRGNWQLGREGCVCEVSIPAALGMGVNV